jgi:hypothetical protein
MRRLLALSLLAFLSVATGAIANPYPEKGPWGPIVPSSQPTFSFDDIICDANPGLLSIYILYVYPLPGGATGVEFSAPKPSCFTGMYLSDTRPFPVTIGGSQTGVSIGFGTCQQPPVHVLTINYYGYGTTPPDCQYRTLPHPVGGEVAMVDCNDNLLYLDGGGGYINSPEGDCETVAIEPRTWGSIKSLFSD